MTIAAGELAARVRQAWSLVDYNPIAAREILVSELLARAVDVRSGERVLDVAAGTGNTALAAARRGARVTAGDLVPAMLQTATTRAQIEGLELEVQVADAQDLPFEDDSFDVVLSSFGVMYAPDQQRAADELLRVCRSGGRIGVVSWTPDGLVGRHQTGMAAHLPASLRPPKAAAPPVMWGTEHHCRQLFGDRVTAVTATVRTHEFCAESAEAQVDFLLCHLPPFQALYKLLPPVDRDRLTTAAAAEFARHNRATDGTLVACADYLELLATVT